jgi:hypothetical protein
MKKIANSFYITFFFFIFLSPAYAYLDPGSINILLQSILAAVAGLAATYKLWTYKIKIFLNKIIKKNKSDNNHFKK